jgi:transcriptional regulator with XRE-family HTH domain
MGLYSNDFSKAFSKLLEKTDVSCYSISRYTNLDEGYLSRLRNGEKGNPSPETVVRICLALAHFNNKLELHDFENLFRAVGRSLFPNLKTTSYD